MDVFNKFYSTVSTTVSQLQGVLPGNPVTREYEVIAHVASAGSGKNAVWNAPVAQLIIEVAVENLFTDRLVFFCLLAKVSQNNILFFQDLLLYRVSTIHLTPSPSS